MSKQEEGQGKERVGLKKGTRVHHAVFPQICGWIEDEYLPGYYTVRVDPKCEHFSETVAIFRDEILLRPHPLNRRTRA